MKSIIRISLLMIMAIGATSCATSSRNSGIRPIGDGMYVISNRSDWGWTHAAYESALYQGENFCAKRGMAFDLVSSDPYKSSRPYQYYNYYYGDAYDLDQSSGATQEVVFSCDPGSYKGDRRYSSYYDE